MKRITALILSLLLIVAVLPVSASAETVEGRLVRQKIEDHYAKILEASEHESLKGYCGTLASYQLYYLGINPYVIMADGNDQYDTYKDSGYTRNGYRIKTYSAENYTMEQALNTITRGGTWDAYNILVGFQTTTTEAGALYGHAVVIYAILDGMVYFTESYATTFVEHEGYPASCTISQFAALYDGWTEFEGIVLFGQKGYEDNCALYEANMYVQSLQDAPLYTQPCSPDCEETESSYIRSARPGERLLVTGLYENTLGEYFYQVDEGSSICYVQAELTEPVRYNTEDVVVSNLTYPEVLTPQEDLAITGLITARNSYVGAVELVITDEANEIIMTHSRAKKTGSYDLKKDTFDTVVDFGILEEGLYTYTLTADILNNYVDDGEIITDLERVTLFSRAFAVGEGYELPAQDAILRRSAWNGWVLRDQTWYYYEQGMPRTGWLSDNGVEYYLHPDGAVTTGWAQINGKNRYFSANGAMCTGWLNTQEGTWYLLSNGEPACGWWTIDSEQYYFDEAGLLLAQAIMEDDQIVYQTFGAEDIAIPPMETEN